MVRRAALRSFATSPRDRSFAAQVSDMERAYMLLYADILFRWGMNTAMVEVRSLSGWKEPEHSGLVFATKCRNPACETSNTRCSECARVVCIICRFVREDGRVGLLLAPAELPPPPFPPLSMRIKSLSTFCSRCGHGGHFRHMDQWFSEYKQCPATGCACSCRQQQQAPLSPPA